MVYATNIIAMKDSGLVMIGGRRNYEGWDILRTDKFGNMIFHTAMDSAPVRLAHLVVLKLDTSEKDMLTFKVATYCGHDTFCVFKQRISINGGKVNFTKKLYFLDSIKNFNPDHIIEVPDKGYLLEGAADSTLKMVLIDTNMNKVSYKEYHSSYLLSGSTMATTSTGFIAIANCTSKIQHGLLALIFDVNRNVIKTKYFDNSPTFISYFGSRIKEINNDYYFFGVTPHETKNSKILAGSTTSVLYISVLRLNKNLDAISSRDIIIKNDSVTNLRNNLSNELYSVQALNKGLIGLLTGNYYERGSLSNYFNIIDSMGNLLKLKRLDNYGVKDNYCLMSTINLTPDGGFALGGVSGYDSSQPEIMKFSDTSLTTAINTSFFNQENQFNIYPNPATKAIKVYIKEPNNSFENKISIYNIQGLEVQSYKISTREITINRNDLPAGMYLIKLQNKEGKVELRKFIWE
jgi:hypothetical protein